jgi:hypothetical protein
VMKDKLLPMFEAFISEKVAVNPRKQWECGLLLAIAFETSDRIREGLLVCARVCGYVDVNSIPANARTALISAVSYLFLPLWLSTLDGLGMHWRLHCMSNACVAEMARAPKRLRGLASKNVCFDTKE